MPGLEQCILGQLDSILSTDLFRLSLRLDTSLSLNVLQSVIFSRGVLHGFRIIRTASFLTDCPSSPCPVRIQGRFRQVRYRRGAQGMAVQFCGANCSQRDSQRHGCAVTPWERSLGIHLDGIILISSKEVKSDITGGKSLRTSAIQLGCVTY